MNKLRKIGTKHLIWGQTATEPGFASTRSKIEPLRKAAPRWGSEAETQKSIKTTLKQEVLMELETSCLPLVI
jgi:hypothetical protein